MSRFIIPNQFEIDANGAPLSGAKLYFYASGTSTPKDTYSDVALTTANSNPVVADSAGRFGDIFMSGAYKVILKTSLDVEVWTADPVSGDTGSYNVASMSDLVALSGSFAVVTLLNYHSDVEGGGGVFVWDSTGDKATHNGGTIIDPDITFPTDWTNQTQLATWFTAGTGTGVFRRKTSSFAINLVDFGSRNDADSSYILQHVFNVYAGLGKFIDNYDNLVIRDQVNAVNKLTFRNFGRVVIDSDIPAATKTGALVCDGKDRFKFIGGEIEVTFTTYDNNIILSQNNTNCLFADFDIIDYPVDRYPLAPIRSLNNSRCRYRNIDVSTVGGIAMQTFGDDDCTYVSVTTESATTNKSLIETNDGTRNIYLACTTYSPANTVTSSFSFNDKYSVALGNLTVGGAYGVTVGHSAPYEANYSVVAANVSSGASNTSFNIQATKYAVVGLNVADSASADYSYQGTLGSEKVALIGNVGKDAANHGYRTGARYTVVGNISDECANGYRPHVDDGETVAVGNLANGGNGTGFNFGIIAGMIRHTLVGNVATDDKVTPTLVTGFKANEQSLMIGNATDGNATFRQFDGNYSSNPNKDMSDTTRNGTPFSKNLSGGAGSAGAGTQYVGLEINGITYKFLHDGTI